MNVLEVKQPKIKNSKKSRKMALNLENIGRSINEGTVDYTTTNQSQLVNPSDFNPMEGTIENKNRTQAEWTSV